VRIVNPIDRCFYAVRDDVSVCCNKTHGTKAAAEKCGDKPARPVRTRVPKTRDRDEDEDGLAALRLRARQRRRGVPVSAPLDLDQIERLAREATPGPWRASGEYYLLEFVADMGALVLSAPGQRVSQSDRAANAAYLEAVSPDVVLSLLERIKKAEAERDRLRALVSEAHDRLPDHEVELRRRIVEAL
jgi:hypothetical protein